MMLNSLPPPFPVHPMCPACGKADCPRYTGGACPASSNMEVPPEWELVPKEKTL